MSDRFNILSLSGGGFFGLYTISVLADLENRCGKPIAQCFDLIAGTSVGGIIALGLAAEIPASKIKLAFENDGKKIFSDHPVPGCFGQLRDFIRFSIKPRYQASALYETVSTLIGSEICMKDLVHPVIIPAVNLTKGEPQIFKTPHHINFKIDGNRKVSEVAVAAAAAPTYFPIAEISDELYADGALYANSPDLLAVHEAEYFFKKPIEEIYLLSLGTTTSQFSIPHAFGRQLGTYGWCKEQRLVNVMIASQQHSVAYMMKHRLNDRYLRLDTKKSKDQEKHLALDVATKNAQKTIRGLANATSQAYCNDQSLESFLTYHAPAPIFYNKVGD